MPEPKPIQGGAMDTDLVSIDSKVSHRGTNAPNIVVYEEIRIPSQAIRNLITDKTGVIHTVKLYGGALFESSTIAKIAEKLAEQNKNFRQITIKEIRIWLAIVFRQGYDKEAKFKSLYDIAKTAGFDRKTKQVKEVLNTLKSDILYIADTRKKKNQIIWTTTKFIESTEPDKHTYRNIYLPTDKSFAKFNYYRLLDYLSLFNTKTQEIAFHVFALVVQRVGEKSSHEYRWVTFDELESKIFYLMVIHRNSYETLLTKCMDGLVEIGIIQGYTKAEKMILLHKNMSSNKRKSSSNKRKSSSNKRRPIHGNPDFIG